MKVSFVAAGSVVFTKNLMTDILDFPELRGATIALHDIDPERLETAGMMARWTSEQLGAGARVEEYLDRRGSLDRADAGEEARPRLPRRDARPPRPERALPG